MESVILENLNHDNNINPKKPLHIAMFPFLAFGHITPFINLSNALVSHTDNIQISFLTTPTIIRRIQSSFTNDNIQLIPITLPEIHGLEPGLESTSDVPPSSARLLTLAVDKMQPQIKSHLSHLKPHFIFFDFAQHWIPELCSQLGTTTTIKSVHFSVFSAIADSYITSPSRNRTKLPSMDEMKRPPNGEYPPESNLIRLKTFEAQNLLYVFKTFDGGESVFDRKNKGIQSCDAIVYKTCFEMESPYINYLKTQYGKPVFLTGLLLPNPPSPHSSPATKTFAWLDKFQPKSVIFCSFGSETFLQPDQMQELALGLELTGFPFILVISSTTATQSSSPDQSYEVSGGDGDIDHHSLPSGYLDRVKGKGMVMTGWIPQREILMHKNVGCYVTHCGLSSLMEGLMGDCQLVLVPFKGDQFLNAKLMSWDLGVGVEVNRRDEDGWFGKYDVVDAVRKVMGEVDEESVRRVNQKKWRESVMNREVGEMYVAGLVEKLKGMMEGE